MANKRQKKKATTKPIKIFQRDIEEYNRLAKNTKGKVNRVQKKYGIDLSDEIDLRPLESFKTRDEFNEWKHNQQWFTNRSNDEYQFKKNDEGIVATKSQLKRIVKNTKQAQKNVDKMIEHTENLPFLSGGKETGETIADRRAMERKPTVAGISRPIDFDFNNIKSYKRLNEVDENMERKANGEYYDQRMEKLKQNFMEHLEESFNSDADQLVHMINSLPADDFYEMYLMFDEFSFELYYVSKGMSEEAKEDNIGQMISYIEAYYNGEIDFDLKGFRP